MQSLFNIFLGIVIVMFILIAYSWISNPSFEIKNSSANIMIALGTIVYAIFTCFMFLNMKSSSEAQVRPLLITNFDDELNLHLSNKIAKNPAKNVKLRIKAIPLKHFKQDSNFTRFIHKYIFAREWSWIWDYFGSYKEYYDIFEVFTKIDLSEYILSKVPILKKTSKWGDASVKSKLKKEIVFKFLISISYDSLLDITYDLNERYIIRIKNNEIKINKIIQ